MNEIIFIQKNENVQKRKVILITGSCFIMSPARIVLSKHFNKLKNEVHDGVIVWSNNNDYCLQNFTYNEKLNFTLCNRFSAYFKIRLM